jgi:putative hydrolase of the HAD superfamily
VTLATLMTHENVDLDVLLDLDDTLYPEHDYLLSGIRAVARFAATRLGREAEDLDQSFHELLKEPEGRAELFDRLLRRFNAWSPGLVATLVHVYRTHEPELSPCMDVIPALLSLRGTGRRIGLVSDGPATVQRLKLKALGLVDWFDVVVFTDDLPPGCRKPSQIPFLVAAEALRTPPRSLAYIADDPAKDFLAPRQLGMRTIRVNRRLPHALQSGTSFPETHLADFTASDLKEALDNLLKCASSSAMTRGG